MSNKKRGFKYWGGVIALWGALGVAMIGSVAVLALLPGIGWLLLGVFACGLIANSFTFWKDNQKAYEVLRYGTTRELEDTIILRELITDKILDEYIEINFRERGLLFTDPQIAAEEKAKAKKQFKKAEKQRWRKKLQHASEAERQRLLTYVKNLDSQAFIRIDREIVIKTKLGYLVKLSAITIGIAFAGLGYVSVPAVLAFLGISSLALVPGLLPVLAMILAIGVGLVYGMQMFKLMNNLVKRFCWRNIKQWFKQLFYPIEWKNLSVVGKIKLVIKDVLLALSLPAVIVVAFMVNMAMGGVFYDAIFRATVWLTTGALPRFASLLSTIITATLIVPAAFLFTLEHSIETVRMFLNFVLHPQKVLRNFINAIQEECEKNNLHGGAKVLCYVLTIFLGVVFMVAASVHCLAEGSISGQEVKEPGKNNLFVGAFGYFAKWISIAREQLAVLLTTLAHVGETFDFATDATIETPGATSKILVIVQEHTKVNEVLPDTTTTTGVYVKPVVRNAYYSGPTSISDYLGDRLKRSGFKELDFLVPEEESGIEMKSLATTLQV